ncbi:MAG: hypothetical protein U1F35_18790 [Steroidobacteraceae bacterium]
MRWPDWSVRATSALLLLPIMLAMLAAGTARAAHETLREESGTVFANLKGEVLLDNERVIVHSFVLAPGQSTGKRAVAADQLMVFIRGGTLKSTAGGRSTMWHDGRVAWLPADEPADSGVTNVGTQPIRFEVVSFKPLVAVAGSPAASPAGASKFRHLNYPNIPGEDLLENDEVIVQRFLVQPGQWEGVHAHHPDMLYIHVKGGRWAARSYTGACVYPDDSPDGSVGWMRTTPITEGHESQNAGKEPIDLIWVTLKR